MSPYRILSIALTTAKILIQGAASFISKKRYSYERNFWKNKMAISPWYA